MIPISNPQIIYFFIPQLSKNQSPSFCPIPILFQQFAIQELKGLSDSGIYQTLTLSTIHSSEKGKGVFHMNYYFTITLTSPEFNAPTTTTTSGQIFDLIVMKSLDDDVYSFAIDEFPEFSETNIHTYWIQMVEKHKLLREISFQQIEKEELNRDARNVGIDNVENVIEELKNKNNEALQKWMKETEAKEKNLEKREIYLELGNAILDARWNVMVEKEQSEFDVHVDLVRERSGGEVFVNGKNEL